MSGQYSTLTRFNYAERASDLSIHPRYLEKVWEIDTDVEVIDFKLNETDIFFPFKTSVDANYRVFNLLDISANKISIDLKNWTKHIIYEGFSSISRQTGFYPDFTGSDSYAFMLQFDNPVTLDPTIEEIKLDNEFGIFTFCIKQTGPTHILINSYFLTKQPFIEKSQISSVEEIFKTIENTEKTILNVYLESE